MIQLVVAEGVFCVGLKRRPMFWLLFFAALAILIAGTFLIVFISTVFNVFILSSSLAYICIFLLSVVLMKLCFDSSWIYLLFRSVSGYATQNMGYVIFSAIWTVCWTSGWFVELSKTFNVWDYNAIINGVICLIVDVAVYFVFARRFRQLTTESLYSGQVLALSLVALSVVVLFCTLAGTYASWIAPLYIGCMLFCALFCIFILILQSGMLQSSRYRHEIAVINGLLSKEKRQYELTKESIQTINIKCHDLRHRLRALRSGTVTDGELREVESAISVYDSNMKTGNETLDIVLTEHKLHCESKGITFMCLADAHELGFMSNSDIYSLFGNILENAAFAVSGVGEDSRKFINFTVKKGANMLFVSVENCYEGNLVFENGLPKTTNPDVENHGYGLKSVKLLVGKYGGDLYISAKEGIFSINIALPFSDKKLAA